MENYRVFYTAMELPAGAGSPTIKLIPPNSPSGKMI